MRQVRILIFFISIICVGSAASAQESDSIAKSQKYGIRVGVDISKPLRSIIESGYTGFEVGGDFRISRRFYLAVELGNEKKDRIESNLISNTSGSYLKIGGDFNAYNNWLGMDNAIFAGLRYGLASFKQELLGYGIYTTNQAFSGDFRIDQREYSGLTAHWAELIVGVKTEILNNLYLSINLQLKQMISDDKPENFDNLYVPGFNRTYDFSKFGAGYGYSISYLIPIFNK